MDADWNKLTDGEVAKLILDAQNGDENSFEVIYRAFTPLRRAIARRYMNRGVDNNEVRQEVDAIFCAAVMNYDPTKDSSPKRHILSYTRIRASNFYRKQRKWLREAVIHYENIPQLEGILNKFGRLDEYMVTQEEEIVSSLDAANILKSLNSRQQRIAFMYYFSDMTQEEISDVIGVDQSTISRSLSDIRNTLAYVIKGGGR